MTGAEGPGGERAGLIEKLKINFMWPNMVKNQLFKESVFNSQ